MQSVSVGRNCLLAQGVSIRDNDGHPLDVVERRKGASCQKEDVSPVIVGDDVWIGAGATILKGVAIGDRAIVGSQAVVTKNVPADAIVAGNPAHVVKSLAQADANGRSTEEMPESHAEQPGK